MNRFEAGIITHLFGFFLICAVVGIPFYFWNMSDAFGYTMAVISGIVIYPIMLAGAWQYFKNETGIGSHEKEKISDE